MTEQIKFKVGDEVIGDPEMGPHAIHGTIVSAFDYPDPYAPNKSTVRIYSVRRTDGSSFAFGGEANLSPAPC